MVRRVILLRAVNVGGNLLTMPRLQEALSHAGFGPARTVGASGNAVVEVDAETPDASIEAAVEAALAEEAGLRTTAFVRNATEWAGVVRSNPFHREAMGDPAHLVVAALRSAPRPAAWAALTRSIAGRERVKGSGRHAYIVYPDGIGRSKLTAAVLERELGTLSTSRNWNTVQALLRLVEGAPGSGPAP